jgi:hypothetical protein
MVTFPSRFYGTQLVRQAMRRMHSGFRHSALVRRSAKRKVRPGCLEDAFMSVLVVTTAHAGVASFAETILNKAKARAGFARR